MQDFSDLNHIERSLNWLNVVNHLMTAIPQTGHFLIPEIKNEVMVCVVQHSQ